jgi:hypothetical protein
LNIDYVYDALAAVRDAIPQLPEALIPGTPRRWTQSDLTEEQRRRMDARARDERDAKAVLLAYGMKALGEGKAPLRLDVLDAEVEIRVGVYELEDAACERLDLTPLDCATTEGRIARLIGLLRRIDDHEDLAEHVASEATRLRRLASRAIGDSEPVHRINGRCPICSAVSLRAFPEREVIVCVNPGCRCSDEDCPCWWEPSRRHRWLLAQWSTLAVAIGATP